MRIQIRSVSLAVLALMASGVTARAQTTVRASVSTGGVQGSGESPGVGARISGNGQFVAFRSVANNLVAGDTNGYADIFVRDLAAGTTTRVSVASGGSEAHGGDSNNPSISADGRFVSFTSHATDLITGDTNGAPDVFVHDRQLGTTTLVSLSASGIGPGNGVSDSSAVWSSADGLSVKVVFRSLAGNLIVGGTTGSQVFVRDVTSGTNTLVSVAPDGITPGNADSGMTQTSISGDGLTIGFASFANNLVVGDTNNASDIFVRSLPAGVTSRVSVTNSGAQGNGSSYSCALSQDGRYVAFASQASNLVAGDTNGCLDIFVRDRTAGSTARVSVDSSGKQGNDSSGNSNGWGIAISGNGMRVAFQSLATNLSKGDNNGYEDIFLRDRTANTTVLVSASPTGKAANGSSGGLNTCGVSLSANGQTVMFASYAANLIAGDTNGWMDVFVRGPF